VPITGNIGKLYPSEAYVTFRRKKAKAMADQITTVSKKRLMNSAGSISSTEMENIGKAITTQLGL
jgi:mRNA interferase MazF